MRIRKRNKIFLRVFLLFGSLVIAVTLFFILMVVPLQKKSLEKIMYTQAITVSRSIVQACSDALISENFSFVVEHNVEVLKNISGIRYVLISPLNSQPILIEPKTWKVIKQLDHRYAKYEIERENFHFLTVNPFPKVYHFVYPINFSGIKWGWIHIGFSPKEYDQYIQDMYLQISYITGISSLIILIIGYIIAQWITQPVAQLSLLANQVAKGDLSVKADIHRNDEIGQLSNSFNMMIGSLKQSQDRLENYNLALEQDVANRTLELDNLNKSLDQRVKEEVAQRREQEQLLIHQSRLAAMGEMVGAIAHQWRQPLNALGLVLQNLQLAYQQQSIDDEFMNRSMNKSERLISKMSSTIDDFRDFFKPNKKLENFFLSQVIQTVVELMEATLKNLNIEFVVECDKNLKLAGFQGELSHVILNLIINAKDSLLESPHKNPRIILTARQEQEQISIKVIDNGRGVEESILQKIYEPYFTTKLTGSVVGMGIGLYMSKIIIENNMHGKLYVVNNDVGATFVIELPA